ncbi:UTP--glucose-1-phosphate uridylyltransferase GalU [Ostreibacterium oceani]|uniref:UTP--glucose-1-phosphate uridylyltransferase n=1 Tax=Ostreibacterium oceani TaxID=2654998 RepID=A0A6N7EUN6_9GAMM|nr:UTP--glucose-1-phosphate uridylyltransferase GalU [Ostreibacterium oceani]MPV85325.1 UTP--glucose-1-phosphate uridylyltransferase GalU [Ostreibacterium oceani]
MKIIRKAVIPVAGLGTRMLPATKAIPKEMLPVVDKPMIQYIVEECAAAGLNEIILVTHSSKNAIENHFDTSYELESMLEKRVKRQQLTEVQSITPPGVTIMHVRQGHAKGLGHAILCAYPLIGDEPFAVVLPDVLIDHKASDLTTDNLGYMLNAYKKNQHSQIMVEAVPESKVSQYGIVDLKQATLLPSQSVAIHSVIEKPMISQAPSQLAIVGRYVFSPHIWQCLKKTLPGVGGEVQLTDAIDILIKDETVEATLIHGQSHDCGSKIGYLKTNLIYALRDPLYQTEIKQVIATIKESI